MERKGTNLRRSARRGVEIAAVGALTGAFVGVVVTLFNCLVELCEEFSREKYGYLAEHPAFIPLLFVGLFLGAVVVGGFVRFLPIIRGSGFPQTEGAAQGLLRFKWYKVLTGMFAASLVVIFFGLSAGSEGPSLMIGGAVGDGLGQVTRRSPSVRRYLITGGACAGLAVSLNAPLTGIVFAYEETHKRFTPEVFACSFFSVVVAMVIRSLLAPALLLEGKPILFNAPIFAGYTFAVSSLDFLLYALIAAVVVSLLGVGFYFAALGLRKLFRKICPKRLKWSVRMLIPFMLAGAFGLISVYAMGSGKFFIESLASPDGTFGEIAPLFSSPLWVTLLVAVLLRFVATACNLGAETPCCTSFPFFAIGAGTGALLSLLFVKMGMPAELTESIVIICLATFFATVVKAPFTAIIMTVELTGSFLYLLPVVLSVAVSILIGRIFRTEPLYERLLEDFLEETKGTPVAVGVRVHAGAGSAIRDILWPQSAFVVSILRGGKLIPATGDAELLEGDILTVKGEPLSEKDFLSELTAAVGEVFPLPAEQGEETENGPPMSEGRTP